VIIGPFRVGRAVMSSPIICRTHLRRLRQMYRSAGWPCQDSVEIELLGTGLIERVPSSQPELRPDTLRVTDKGVQALMLALSQNRQSFSAHETLVRRCAQWLATQGRLAWTGLSLFASPSSPGPWRVCRPDVFSLRASSAELALEPAVHEIKVSRADLLGDLHQPDKRGAYLDLAQRVWYVLGQTQGGGEIADPSEIPAECGVLLAEADTLRVVRPAPAREARPLALATWLALAKNQPVEANVESPQLQF